MSPVVSGVLPVGGGIISVGRIGGLVGSHCGLSKRGEEVELRGGFRSGGKQRGRLYR